MPRARLARFAIAAILLALTAAGCSTVVSGAGQLVAPSTAPDATLAVVGDGHTSFDRLARNSIARHTWRRVSSSILLQPAISGMVRRQPSQKPLRRSMQQTEQHGEGTSPAAACTATARSASVSASAKFTPRRPPARR